MFRHGAREPTAIKNNVDEFGEKWLTPGELTPVGKRMHFLLGLRNREVYRNFTTRAKIDGSVFIRSTDYNRTMESVQAQMQGFFPPGSAALLHNQKLSDIAHPFMDDPRGQNWKSFGRHLNLRSIVHRVETFPVHLFSRDDPFNQFFYNPYACKPYLQMSQENIKRPVIQDFMKKFKEEYGARMSNMTGKPIETLDNYWYLFGLFDSYISDVYDGRELKKPKEFGIDLEKFNRTAFEFAENDIITQFNGDVEYFFARWTVSILWPEVIAFMERRIAADKEGKMIYTGYELPRFVFFSTHDVTVGSGLTVLNRAFGFKKYYTPFASDLFFELHRKTNGEYEVYVKYQSLTLGVVPFGEFKEKLEKQFLTREQIAEKCGWHPDESFMGHATAGGSH